MKHHILAALLALSVAPAAAQDARGITEQDDGSALIDAAMADIGTVSDGTMRTGPDFAERIGAAFRGTGDVDFTQGHIVPGPVRLSITRDDGSVGFHDIDGDLVIFDAANTFDESGMNLALDGVAVFAQGSGPLRPEAGTMSLTKMD